MNGRKGEHVNGRIAAVGASIACALMLFGCGPEERRSDDEVTEGRASSATRCVVDPQCSFPKLCHSGSCLTDEEAAMARAARDAANAIPPDPALVGPLPFEFVQIRSRTFASPYCEDASEGNLGPGPDLIAMSLLDAEGNVLGWANTHDWMTDEDNAESRPLRIFNGRPNPEGQDRCLGNASVVGRFHSVGCDASYLVVDFRDADDAVIPLLEGYRVRVIEHGPGCPSGNSEDDYEVKLCTHTAAVQSLDVSSCWMQIGRGAGRVDAEIRFPIGTVEEMPPMQ